MIQAGHIYIIDTAISNPRKDKITLCICAGDNYFLWINTNPRHDGRDQLALTAKDHRALSHPCYLDCSGLRRHPEKELAKAQHRGVVDAILAEKIYDFLEQTPPEMLPERHRKMIVELMDSFCI